MGMDRQRRVLIEHLTQPMCSVFGALCLVSHSTRHRIAGFGETLVLTKGYIERMDKNGAGYDRYLDRVSEVAI